MSEPRRAGRAAARTVRDSMGEQIKRAYTYQSVPVDQLASADLATAAAEVSAENPDYALAAYRISVTDDANSDVIEAVTVGGDRVGVSRGDKVTWTDMPGGLQAAIEAHLNQRDD